MDPRVKPAGGALFFGDPPMTNGPSQINGHIGAAAAAPGRKGDLKQRAIHEVKTLFVMFLYLWALLAVFVLHESIVLAQRGISFTGFGVAGVNALILAKIMLVADNLHLARGLKDKPLIYPVLYQSAAFAVVFVCFHVLEKVIGGFFGGHTVSQSISAIDGGHIMRIVSAGAIVTIALIPFFAFRELGRVIGERELHALIFTRGAKAGAQRELSG
jgi:hypothetical protein